MIYTDSRYATGKLLTAHDARKDDYFLTVYRNFPNFSVQYFLYVWNESDRLDTVANMYLGSSAFWWKIMDVNPELLNPFDIPLGTTIRIPIA